MEYSEVHNAVKCYLQIEDFAGLSVHVDTFEPNAGIVDHDILPLHAVSHVLLTKSYDRHALTGVFASSSTGEIATVIHIEDIVSMVVVNEELGEEAHYGDFSYNL